MVVGDLQAQLEGRLNQAGLLPYFDKEESRFVDLEEDFLVELVARDSTKLPEFGRIAKEVEAKNPKVRTLVRAHWEVDSVGQPVPAYNMETGTPRTAAAYPLCLKSGQGEMQVWIEVTTLANLVFRDRGFDSEAIKRVVRDFADDRLKIGGSGYWDPIRFPQLEINRDTAEYIASKRSAKQ